MEPDSKISVSTRLMDGSLWVPGPRTVLFMHRDSVLPYAAIPRRGPTSFAREGPWMEVSLAREGP